MRFLAVGLLLLAVVAAWAAPAGRAQTGALESQAGSAKDRERELAAATAALDAQVARVDGQLKLLGERRAELVRDLGADRARLAVVVRDLRSERRRAARLKRRLRGARAVLSARMVAQYKDPTPDLVLIALAAQDLGDLVARAKFIQRIATADKRIISTVRRAREDATLTVAKLDATADRNREIIAGMEARRRAIASMAADVASRRAEIADARAARAAALAATRDRRVRIERRIAAVRAAAARAARTAAREAAARAARAAAAAAAQAEQQREATASAPSGAGVPSGGWAIPADIVMCESGGQNLPPNHAGASGYYQIIPGTWRLHGGSGPAAWKASKAEQDRVAAAIWDGGRGADQWVCHGLVN